MKFTHVTTTYELFKLYRHAVHQQHAAVRLRRYYHHKGRVGIAVDKDEYALMFQRWRRLERSIEPELEHRLARLQENNRE